LRNITNIQSIFSTINDRHIDIALLQETFWDNDFIESISHMWEGKILHCCSDNQRSGVAVLINKSYADCVDYVYGFGGRLLHITLTYNNSKYNVFNIYAPNILQERHAFFCDLASHIRNHNNVILAGDFNTTLSYLDRDGRTDHQQTIPYRDLCKIIDNNNMSDIWRKRNGRDRVFSRKQVINGVLTQSRIDYYLLSNNLKPHVQTIYYNDTTFSDHAFVIMKMDLDLLERGPGVWVLNNCVLAESEYTDKVRSMINNEMESTLFHSELSVWWDNLKYKLKTFSQLYCKERNKQKYAEYYKIQNRLQSMSRLSAEGVDIDIVKYQELKTKLEEYEQEKCNGAILRAKAFWALESDRNTKYFLNLEKHKQGKNGVSELCTENGNIVTDTESILKEQYNFYSSLYSCISVEKEDIDSFAQNIVSSLDEDDVIDCDKDIDCSEIKLAVNSMAKNKSPGQDGLTVEFYCVFYDVLENILLKLYQDIDHNNELPVSMKKA
jgi:exonuclease III